MTKQSEEPIKAELAVSTSGYKDLIKESLASGLGVEQLKTLFELQERFEANAARKEYVTAMCNFQQDCPTILQSGRNRNLTTEGVRNSGCYTDLRIDILPVVGRLCGLHGFIFRFDSTTKDGLTIVTCTVTHESGHSESSSFTGQIDARDNKRVSATQKMGATLTYAQRQAIIMVFGLRVGDPDEDGLGEANNEPLIKSDLIVGLEKEIERVGIDMPKLLKFFRVENLEQITSAQYKEAQGFVAKRGNGK